VGFQRWVNAVNRQGIINKNIKMLLLGMLRLIYTS